MRGVVLELFHGGRSCREMNRGLVNDSMKWEAELSNGWADFVAVVETGNRQCQQRKMMGVCDITPNLAQKRHP